MVTMTAWVAAPLPQMMGICGSCADHTTGVRADSCARFHEVIIEVIRFIPQERIVAVFPAPQTQELIVGVAKNIPQEQVRLHCGAGRGVPVPQIM